MSSFGKCGLKEGKTVAVDPAIWATNDAEALFRECTYDGLEIFVSDKAVSLSQVGSEAGAEIKPTGDVSSSPLRFTRAEAEAAYKKRVEGWPQNQRHPSRDADEAWLLENFRVTRETAREIRREFAPSGWRKGGAPKTTSREPGRK